MYIGLDNRRNMQSFAENIQFLIYKYNDRFGVYVKIIKNKVYDHAEYAIMT